MMNDKTFIIVGLIIAIFIGIVAVFFASGDPDGLESTALFISGEKELTGATPENSDPENIGTKSIEYFAPMPDYSMGEESGPAGGIVAIVLGTILSLLVAIGAFKLVTIVSK